MSTTGTEKHCRLCLMLNKGGTRACHSLLLKRVEELTPNDHHTHPWTVHEFLQSKKKEMLKSKMSKEKLQVLFPSTGATDLAKWDLSLFCTVLTTYCGLKQLICIDVNYLRKFRNELCHMNDPDIDDQKYHDYFETIKVVVERILKEANDDETKQAIERILKDLHEGPLSLDETLKEMRTIYLMEWDIGKRLEELKDIEERVLQKVESVDQKLVNIDSKLDNSARNNVLLPGVQVTVDLKNLSTDEEQRMSVVLEQLFEEVIHEDDEFTSTIPADSYNKLRKSVRKTFELFLSKGWRITSAKPKCVQLHIRCLTLKSLAALFREHVQGHINNALADLNSAISEAICKEETQLETIIYKQEFWTVMEKTMSVVEEYMTDEYSDFGRSLDKEKQCDETEGALLITARNISHEGQLSLAVERENELDTCLTLLRAELVSELNAPDISVTASFTPGKTQIVTDKASSTDVKIPMLKEIHKHAHVERELKKEDYIRSKVSTKGLTKIDPPGVSVKPSYKQDWYLSTGTSSLLTNVQSVDEHQSKAFVDSEKQDELQTIALLELYKSQRAISHFLELAFLSFTDHQDIADEVYTASLSARRKHQRTANCGWEYLVNKIEFLMDNFYIGVGATDDIIYHAQRLTKVTKELKESYIELQDTIRNLKEHCANLKSLHKEAKSYVKTMNILEKSSEKELVHKFDELQSKVDIKRTSSETDTGMMYEDVRHEMKWMMSESPGKHNKEKLEMKTTLEQELLMKWTKDEYGRYAETIFTKLLRPGYALTGGLFCRSISDARNLFLSVNRGKELETLMMLQNETRSTEGAMDVEMMRTQRIEALERLTTIRIQENENGGLECLKEVEKHLKYIDIQFGRINDCWLQLIYGLTLLKDEGRLGHMYRSHIRERRRMEIEVWSFVRYLFWAYSEVGSSDERDLYSFLLERGRDDLAERRRELFVVIGKEISGTPFSLDSSRPSDQSTYTGFEEIEENIDTKKKQTQMFDIIE